MRYAGGVKAVTAVAVAGAVIVAPEFAPQEALAGGYGSVAELIDACRDSGLKGWELVAYAQQQVHTQYLVRSYRQPWRSPESAFAARKAYAVQYNLVLRDVLRALGFRAEAVFAARVRTENAPWWRMAHVWVRVRYDGRTKSCCARHATAPGVVDFVPVSDVVAFKRRTQANLTAAMTLVVGPLLWKAMLSRRRMPEWLEVPF